MQNRRKLFFVGTFNALTGGGGGDPDRKRQILIAVTVLIGLVAAFSFYKQTAGSDKAKQAKNTIPFICVQCDNLEYFSRDEIFSKSMPMGPDMGLPLQDCPKCNGKQTMEQAEKCPNCETIYLCEPPEFPGMPREEGCVCPECGMSLIDAHRKKYRKTD